VQNVRRPRSHYGEAFSKLLAVECGTGVGDLTVKKMKRRLLSCHTLAGWRRNPAPLHIRSCRRCRALPFGEPLRIGQWHRRLVN
jgi:hypothetical protein